MAGGKAWTRRGCVALSALLSLCWAVRAACDSSDPERDSRREGMHDGSTFRARQILALKSEYDSPYDLDDTDLETMYMYPDDDYEDDLKATVAVDPPPPPPEEPGFAPPRGSDSQPALAAEPVVMDTAPAKTNFKGTIQPAGDDPTPLEMSAQSGNVDELIKALKKEDVNTKFESQGFRTALHLAAQNNHIKIVKILLRNGAEPSPKDEFLNTPLHLAIKNNAYLQLIELLLKARADVNAKNAMEQNALHIALEDMPSLGVLETLVSMGAKLNKQDSDGSTPLHVGAKNGELLAVEFLLLQGADPTIRDKRGFPVIQVVCRTSCREGDAQQIISAIQKVPKN